MSDEQDDNRRAIANWTEDMMQRMAQRLTQELTPLGITVVYEPVDQEDIPPLLPYVVLTPRLLLSKDDEEVQS